MKTIIRIILVLLFALLKLAFPAHGQGHPGATVIHGGIPVVSPDGAHIAFVSERSGAPDLFVIRPDGQGELQLTHTPDHESPIGWTGDGKQVLFSVFANEQTTLYAIDPRGGNQRRLGLYTGRGLAPSPDGKRILYLTGSWTATQLMIAAVDGSNPQQITDGSSIAWNVDWSPDGKRLAFTGRRDPKSELAIFVMNVDGSASRQLSHVAPAEGGAQWPSWSPSGKTLAVQVNSRLIKNEAYIWTVDAASGEARKLGLHDKPYLDETPSWFPDEKRLAFQSDRTGRMEIWVMNVDGSDQRQVTR
jgi:TolB protein